MSTDLQEEVEVSIKEPSMYNVVLHNDDATTFEFVISILQEIFNKSFQDSVIIAHDVHEHGKRIVDSYTKEVANQKVNESTIVARNYGYPLLVTAEEA